MKKEFERLKVTRNNILEVVEGYSIEELNTIPAGFRNNIIWNLGHVLVTQQLLCYKLQELDSVLPSDFIDQFKKGTVPQKKYNKEDFEFIKNQLMLLIDQTLYDYEKGILDNYREYTTSYGLVLQHIDDAISFNNIHESMHYGYILALRKSLI